MGREGHCKHISLEYVGSTCSVSATLGLPLLTACVLSLSILLRLQVALQGAGPELHALPGVSHSDSGSRVLHKGADSVGPAFCAFPSPSSSGNQELDEHTLFRCRATSPLPVLASVSGHTRSSAPFVSSGELISGCNPPDGCQPSRISGSLWLETGRLFAVW